jgi:hypothetical protein
MASALRALIAMLTGRSPDAEPEVKSQVTDPEVVAAQRVDRYAKRVIDIARSREAAGITRMSDGYGREQDALRTRR